MGRLRRLDTVGRSSSHLDVQVVRILTPLSCRSTTPLRSCAIRRPPIPSDDGGDPAPKIQPRRDR